MTMFNHFNTHKIELSLSIAVDRLHTLHRYDKCLCCRDAFFRYYTISSTGDINGCMHESIAKAMCS